MKKLFLLAGIFFAVNFVGAMDSRPVNAFTAEDYGVDIANRQEVIDFYWKKKHALQESFILAQSAVSGLSEGKVKHLFKGLMDKAEALSEGSERDLNTDKFARIFGDFIDEVNVYSSKLFLAQNNPEVRLKKIKKYRDEEGFLKKRHYHFLTTIFDMSVEQEISEVQEILNDARALSSNSQRELGEVELAHHLSPFMCMLERELSKLQSELAFKRDKKRESEFEDAVIKRSRPE